MDLNLYTLERMVEARLGDLREERRRCAIAASAEAERATPGEADGAGHRARRFLRWFFSVPGAAASQQSSP
jgi:hypothetical protein